MSNTTPDPGNHDRAPHDGADHDGIRPEGTEPAFDDAAQNSTPPAVPADEYAARHDTGATDATTVPDEFNPDAFRDSTPAGETRPAGETTPAGEAQSEPAAPVHHHTPEIADQAYAEAPDTHVLSSSEPTVLTQADLHADRVRAEESGRGGDTAVAPVYVDSTAPVAPAPSSAQDERPQPAPVRQPVYVQAPTEPKPKGNRGFGILVSLLATLVFAALYAGVLALLLVVNNGAVDIVDDVLVRALYWIPVLFFFLGLVLLVSIVNRGGWWAYVLGGFLVALIVYGSYLGAVLVEQAASISPSEVGGIVQNALFSPAAVIAFVLAREVPVWFGGWVASRGRKVKERNAEARREYQRILDQGPVVS